MREIRIPDEYSGSDPSVFLAGGAGGRHSWRKDFALMVSDTQWILLNPLTRSGWGKDNNSLVRRTRWERQHLERATVQLFWFPAGQPCMVSLYELGVCSTGDRPIIAGVEKGYAKRDEVLVQMQLGRPEVNVVASLAELAEQLRSFSLTDERSAT